MQSYDIIIVGGGPSGIMAAIRASEMLKPTTGEGRVAIFEKNAALARKLALTGKGRCNLTNSASLETFLESFGKNGSFLRSAFNRFFTPDLFRFFEERGLALKTERQGRVFPVTDKSSSVIDGLEKALTQAKVVVHCSTSVKKVITGQKVTGVCLSDGREVAVHKIIIATGGSSYPQTGSSGDGFKIAAALGHRIEEISPGLVPLEVEEASANDLQGLTLKNISIVFYSGSKKIKSPVGELLFTHFGVSGPLVLDLSAKVAGLLEKRGKVEMTVDLKPGLSSRQLDFKLQREFRAAGTLELKNYFKKILPKRLIAVFLTFCSIDGKKRCNQVKLSERHRIVEALKRFSFTIKRTRPLAEAMVTHGGVSLKEVNPRTLESRKVKGLYFCGEVLDVAAASGGFNLQAAFSTGYLAGESAALSL